MSFVVGAVVILVAAFVKGSIAFGFPLVATPLLVLVYDVKTAVAVSVLPNVVMDGAQLVRRGQVLAMVRRLGVLIACSVLGMWLGTLLLVVMPARVATMVLGGFVLAFVGLGVSGAAPRVPPAWERWLSPPAGLVAGIVGGLTNVPGTPLVIYFYALGMDKGDFVRAISVTFVVVKLAQLGALAWYGVLDGPVLALSLAFTAVALIGFSAGLRLQDLLPERAFNRVVLGFLVIVGAWLIVRSL
jgi:uncharacterized membrane protein YfcA